jgi:hypothetical protein
MAVHEHASSVVVWCILFCVHFSLVKANIELFHWIQLDLQTQQATATSGSKMQ